jgi:hypothetical protein
MVAAKLDNIIFSIGHKMAEPMMWLQLPPGKKELSYLQ